MRSTLAASGTSGSNSLGTATIAHAQPSWMSPSLSTAGRPSSARRAFAIATPGANISTNGPPRKIVYAVWSSVAVGLPDASATSIVVNSMQSTSTASAGSRSSSFARSSGMVELKHSSSIRSRISASKSPGSSIASHSSFWLNGTKRVPTSPHRSAMVRCPISRTSWPRSTSVRAIPSVGARLPAPSQVAIRKRLMGHPSPAAELDRP